MCRSEDSISYHIDPWLTAQRSVPATMRPLADGTAECACYLASLPTSVAAQGIRHIPCAVLKIQSVNTSTPS